MTAPDSDDRWVLDAQYGADHYTENLDGVPWDQAPLPRRWHRCRPQTRGVSGLLYAERCPCGAIRLGLGDPGWSDRNSRRRSR